MTALAFVDLETTGATAATDRITEIGIVLVDPDGSVRAWQQLVNPQVRIPAFIEQLTGISNRMVADAPVFAAVADQVHAHLEGRLFLAHNARFDYGFLQQEFARLGRIFRAPVRCTVKLSRALYPAHRRHGLDALIERHHLHCSDRHRALADAQLIHQFWQKIQVDHGLEQVQSALDAQNPLALLPPEIDPLTLETLPDSPGHYRLLGSSREVLHQSSAKSIRQRVFRHFASHRTSAKQLALARKVRQIDWVLAPPSR